MAEADFATDNQSVVPRFPGADLHYVRWPEPGAEMPASI
jgi:hypothetical protein